MPVVYWVSDGVGEGVTPGGPDGTTPIVTMLMRWIRAQGNASLIVNGGDVYGDGNSSQFAKFLAQMDNDVTLLCETAGNHDWRDDVNTPDGGRIPHGYETFWSSHPESKQPIDGNKRGGARYEHFLDLGGWRLFFLDTGDYDTSGWPAGDSARVTWLRSNLNPGRANIVLCHHSRLSSGQHGHNEKLNVLWESLFDGDVPRVAFTLAGHDHNVNMYGPRSKSNPTGSSVPFGKGIYVFVNGAGGNGLYRTAGFLVNGDKGDVIDDDKNFCVTRINLATPTTVDVDMMAFGKKAIGEPSPLPGSLVRITI
jgi:hypothetical protein